MSTPGSEGSGSTWERVYQALGPIVAGMALDLADFATFGPVGIYTGVLVGGAIGWWMAGLEGVSERHRWIVAAIAGVYCALPFTELVPVATILSVLLRLLHPEPRRPGD